MKDKSYVMRRLGYASKVHSKKKVENVVRNKNSESYLHFIFCHLLHDLLFLSNP